MASLLSRIQRTSSGDTDKEVPSDAKNSSPTLLQEAITSDNIQRVEASAKVAQALSLTPTDDELKHSDRLIKAVSQIFGPRISKTGLTEQLQKEITAAVVEEVCRVRKTYEDQERLKRIVLSSMFGLGPIEPYMSKSSTVSDILVHGYNLIFIEDETGLHKTDAQFYSEQHLRNVIERIVQGAGKQINLISPAVDAKLPDGSRVHATIPPISPDGATLTIRRFNNRKLDIPEYIELKTLNLDMVNLLRFWVEAKLNIIVSGGTGSGKTSLLNVLSSFIPENELIITIEDNCELQLRQPNVRRLEARQAIHHDDGSVEITIQDLVRHSLRMRPDRIIVGEVRDGSIVDMLSAMSTGHEGSMSTIHSDSPQSLFDSRLPLLFSQYSVDFTREAQTLMCAESIHIVVQISRERNFRRVITKIASVEGIDERTGRVKLHDIFTYSRSKDAFVFNPVPSPRLTALFEERGIDLPKEVAELYERGRTGTE